MTDRRRIVIGVSGVALLSAAGVLALSMSSSAEVTKGRCQPLKTYSQPPPGFDPATASNTQLQADGFPPRPPGAPKNSPAYRAWLTAVKGATTFVAPHPVCATRTHGTATSHNPVPLHVRGTPGVPAVARSRSGSGRLVGAIVFTGRVPHSATKNRYHRGWVEVGQHGHLVAKQWVKVNHQYHFTLAAGAYDIAGYTKWGTCRDTARITAGQTTHQDAYCTWH